MATVWRLLPLLDAPGVVQMAVDDWLLDQHLLHGHPPTLRFYTWNPAAISLGVSQRRRIPEHWPTLCWHGQPLDLVQRPTGGRGVLHQGDLTYALVTSDWSGPREQTYRHLCQFLVEGWQRLGVEVSFGARDRPYLKSHHCFGLSTPADLVTGDGFKLVGSAQLRRGPAILQHGSILLNPDPLLYEQVFQTPAPQSLGQRGYPLPTVSQLVPVLTQAAARCWGCQWDVAPLTAEEWQSIQARVKQKMAQCTPTSSHSFA